MTNDIYDVSDDIGKTWEPITTVQLRRRLKFLSANEIEAILKRLSDGEVVEAKDELYRLQETKP